MSRISDQHSSRRARPQCARSSSARRRSSFVALANCKDWAVSDCRRPSCAAIFSVLDCSTSVNARTSSIVCRAQSAEYCCPANTSSRCINTVGELQGNVIESSSSAAGVRSTCGGTYCGTIAMRSFGLVSTSAGAGAVAVLCVPVPRCSAGCAASEATRSPSASRATPRPACCNVATMYCPTTPNGDDSAAGGVLGGSASSSANRSGSALATMAGSLPRCISSSSSVSTCPYCGMPYSRKSTSGPG